MTLAPMPVGRKRLQTEEQAAKFSQLFARIHALALSHFTISKGCPLEGHNTAAEYSSSLVKGYDAVVSLEGHDVALEWLEKRMADAEKARGETIKASQEPLALTKNAIRALPSLEQ